MNKMVFAKKGCIICGFPGVGKSTIAGWKRCVDLEVTNFRIDGEKKEGWYKQYGQVALDLALQGFYVLVGTHKELRDWLRENVHGRVYVFAIYPVKEMKEDWVAKLQGRYIMTRNDKDRRAYERMKDEYENLVDELDNDEIFERVGKIKGLKYDMEELILSIRKLVEKNGKYNLNRV